MILKSFCMAVNCLTISRRYMITMMILLYYANLSGGQRCTDSINVQQSGNDTLGRDRLAIIPRLNFTCNGRITSIRARVAFDNRRSDFLSFQLWRPSSVDPTLFTKVDNSEVQLQSNAQIIRGSNNFFEANIILTGNNIIEFQSGDVVGYYHPPDARYQVVTIQTDGYILYQFSGSPVPTSVNLNNASHNSSDGQPLIQFTIDIRCNDLSSPANGEITSCSSGRVGVGYEGDACSFTCNTGYELTGSDTRTCQSDGSWSDTDVICSRVSCSSLVDPSNGRINCSLGDDGVPSYEDTCIFKCNTGYELISNNTRTCQSDGSWSGRDGVCRRDDVPISNNSDSSSDSSAIIGGAMGGVILLLMITVVLCIVILCVRRSHRKGTFPMDDKVFYNTAKLNDNVAIDNNPAYDVTKANTVGSLYSTIEPEDSDVPITANPSYAVPTKPYSKTSEDECSYLQLNQHPDLEDTVKVDTNPSYGLTTGEDRATAFSAHSADTKATTKQYDYDYVCDDRLLHHNTATNTTGDVKKDIPASVDQSNYMENVHPLCIAGSDQPSNEGEYGVVNQPKSDDFDY